MKQVQVDESSTGIPLEVPAAVAAPEAEAAAPATTPAADRSRETRIREAAYALYAARGHVDGHDVEDWMAAEATVAAVPATAASESAAAAH